MLMVVDVVVVGDDVTAGYDGVVEDTVDDVVSVVVAADDPNTTPHHHTHPSPLTSDPPHLIFIAIITTAGCVRKYSNCNAKNCFTQCKILHTVKNHIVLS